MNSNQNIQDKPFTVPVLDHGFVSLRNISGPTRRLFKVNEEIEYHEGEGPDTISLDPCNLRTFDADDIDPANTARMSFDQTDSNRTREADLKLCDYLMRNWHSTPFEMIEIWLEMKLPIFVARQFVRHRTCTINEVSGRYVMLPAEWYIPEVVGGKAANKKQGQEDNLDETTQQWFKDGLEHVSRQSFEFYCEAVDRGVAPEHARLALGLNHYTHWIWKQDLHNTMHFLRLRMDSHAQVEAQAYARAIYELLHKQLPNSMALFDKYRRGIS